MNAYVQNVGGVTSSAVKGFASRNLHDGEMIIVGDYSIFKDDLAKRFPGMTIEVIKADELNLESPTLRNADLK